MRRRSIRYYVTVVRNVLLLLIFGLCVFVFYVKSLQEEEVTHIVTESGMQYLFSVPHNATNQLNKSEIQRIIFNRNKEERIMNEDIYGPIGPNTVIIVLSVDKYSVDLKFMLFFLSRVKGIQDTLLIFSHSYYDENVDALIKAIDFCRVLQIFFPHSLQLHPNEFPGLSPGDCPHDMKITTAEATNCTGASSWDIHGHYRNPQLSENKHHWWWTANQVFENLNTTEGHIGTVVFVEDPYFFSEDFLYMTLYMKNIASTLSGCEFLSFASRETKEDGDIQHMVEVAAWDPERHSAVFAFDLAVWNSIVAHYDLFCQVDDISWSQSLSYVSFNRRDGMRYKVMMPRFSRAYHPYRFYFGKFLGYGMYSSVYHILELHKRIKLQMFPPNLEVFVDIDLEDDYIGFDVNNGGWNDARDKELCRNMTVSKIKKQLLEMNNQFADYRMFD